MLSITEDNSFSLLLQRLEGRGGVKCMMPEEEKKYLQWIRIVVHFLEYGNMLSCRKSRLMCYAIS